MNNLKYSLGFIAGIISGAIWGIIAMVIFGISLMLISGQITQLPIGSAALAGLASAAVFMARHPGQRSPGLKLVSAMVILLVLVFATLGQPFNLALTTAPLIQLLILLLFVVFVWAANVLCLADFTSGWPSRYSFESFLIRVLKGLGYIFFTVIVALPFFVMLMTSVKSQQALLANPLDFSLDFSQGWHNIFRSYIELFSEFRFATFLLNSTIVSVATVILTLLFSIPGAYAVARLRFPGQAFLSRSILLIYMVPAIILVIPLYSIFSQLGLRNTLTGLLIIYPATTIPVALYMLQGYFRGLPTELEDAGLMDGLSRLGVIIKITLPLALPALASVALYVFMIAWNEFLFAFMFLDNLDIFTLSRGVVSLNSSEVPRQHLMAGAVIATLPILVIFLWFERFLVAGLTAGSVKG